MPIFDLSNDDLLPVEQKNFATEKELQTLIEKKALHENLWVYSGGIGRSPKA